MEKERDVRLVRFDLRLRVGADGDPFDNELHNAWASLPENTVIRNDWLRRRLLLGHILEREGLTELLSVIGKLTGSAPSAASQSVPPPVVPARPSAPAAADFLPPSMEPAPLQNVPKKPSARSQLGGLLPSIKSEPKEENKAAETVNTATEKSVTESPAPRTQPARAADSGKSDNGQTGAKAEPSEVGSKPERKRPPLAGDVS